jgi:predicted NUDIX family phosphoesterase
VYLANAAARPEAVRETHKLSGSFQKMEALRAVYDGMETWSRLALDAIIESEVLTGPSSRALDGGKIE